MAPPERRCGRFQWRLVSVFVVITVVAVHLALAQWDERTLLLWPWTIAAAGIFFLRRVFHAPRIAAGALAIVIATTTSPLLLISYFAFYGSPHFWDVADIVGFYAVRLALPYGLGVGGAVAVAYSAYCVVRSLVVDRADRYYVEADTILPKEPT